MSGWCNTCDESTDPDYCRICSEKEIGYLETRLVEAEKKLKDDKEFDEMRKYAKGLERKLADAEKRVHEKCATRVGFTCVYLADGTKVVVRRAPDVQGRVWVALEPQAIIRPASKED